MQLASDRLNILQESERDWPLCTSLLSNIDSSKIPCEYYRSREWVCPHCKESNLDLLPDPPTEDSASASAAVSPPPQLDTPTPESTSENTPLEIPLTEAPSVQNLSHISPPAETHPEPRSIIHNTDTLLTGTNPTGTNQARSPFLTQVVETPPSGAGDVIQAARRRTHKPPLLLDTAICVLLVLAFAMICRRVV